MTEFAEILFSGVVSASTYLLIALGITMVFGLTRLINFAHGQIVVIGAFVCYEFTSRGLSFWWGLLAALGVTAALALILDRAVFHFTVANPLNGLIAGLGVFYVLQYVINERWGLSPLLVKPPFRGSWSAGGVVFSFNQLVAAGIAVVLTLALLYLIRYTSLGRQMRAVQQDPLAASHSGINTSLVITLAFVIGSAAAGVGGAALGTLFPIDPSSGGDLILSGFAVALLGGLGNVPGAIVASLIYGIGGSLLSGYGNPAWVDYFTYGVIIVILLVRPAGLLGGAVSDESSSDPGGGALDTPRPFRLRLPASLWALFWIAVPALAFAAVSSAQLQEVLTLCAIYAVLAYSLSFLYENVGMLSLAHGAFMAVGAYAGGVLATHLGWGFWAALIPAAALAGLSGLLVGIPVSRAKGHYFLLVTFAVGSLAVVLGDNLTAVTGGDGGLVMTSGVGSIGPLSFGSADGLYFLCLAFAVLAAAAVYLLRRSPWGARFAAIRDNEHLARSLGLNVARYKVLAFGLSSAIAGVGGLLYLYQEQIYSPDSYAVLAVIPLVIMVVLGGRSILGPPVGAAILTVLPQLLNLSPTVKQLASGLLLIVVVLLLPRGVVPGLRDGASLLSRWLARRPGMGWAAAFRAPSTTGEAKP